MTLVLARIVLLFAAALGLAGIVSALSGAPYSVALAAPFSALYFIVANLICFWLLRRALRPRGGSVRELAGYDRGRLGRDALAGLVWLFALFIPFAAALNLVMLVLFGPSGMLAAYETVFTPSAAALVELPRWYTISAALAAALLFPITNAPVEELVYRGHAQGRLLKGGWAAWLAILVPAAAFGLQHMLLAPSAAGMLAYGAAFLCWGATAGVIYLRQRRLMPLIFAHFYTNAMFSVVPLAFLLGPA